MSTEGNAGGSRRPFSRREFLVLGGAGAGALALGGFAARVAARQSAEERFTYKGRKVVVGRRGGRISIDDEPLAVVDTNGTYRAAGYAFDWASNPKDLAKKIVDNDALLARRR